MTRTFQFATASTKWLEKGEQNDAQIPALAVKVKISCREIQTSSKVVCVHVRVCVCVYAYSCLFFFVFVSVWIVQVARIFGNSRALFHACMIYIHMYVFRSTYIQYVDLRTDRMYNENAVVCASVACKQSVRRPN